MPYKDRNDRLKYLKEYREKNKQKIKQEKKEYYENNKEEINNNKKKIYKTRIPLRNREHKIIDYALISKEDYNHLSIFKWYKNTDGYAQGGPDNVRMHRYIMEDILGNDIENLIVDHINGNRLDNRIINLRLLTIKENNRNRLKKKNASSKYYGIIKNKNRWVVNFKHDNIKLYASYNQEIHAAWQYNLWIKEYNIIGVNINNIKEPIDFILYEKFLKKGNDLPQGIIKSSKDKYIVHYKKYIGSYNLEDAIKILNDCKINEIKLEPIVKYIQKNKNNQCIIELFNIKKEKTGETIIDEELYDDLIKYKWYKDKRNYVHGQVNGINKTLHRYVLNYDGKNYIDHINNNPLDNRKENLRIVTKQENCQNRKPTKNAKSKYIGVSKHVIKWMARITVNKKAMHLGLFKTEEEAAKARDLATIKYFGEYGKLNFPLKCIK